MIDIRKLKELVRLMVANELTELDLRDSEEQVTLRRQSPEAMPQVVTMPAAAAVPVAAGPAAAAAPSIAGGGAAGDGSADEYAGMIRIDSPMVGTFYTAANPDSPPFVAVGATVGPDSTVCIIEAMKIFNEIKAETSGTIEKVLVGNGESIEFGQPLFIVRPS